MYLYIFSIDQIFANSNVTITYAERKRKGKKGRRERKKQVQRLHKCVIWTQVAHMNEKKSITFLFPDFLSLSITT